MKIGITVDDVRATKYVVGKFDFYTRQVEVAPDLAAKLQSVEALYAVSQRILSSLYNSNGRFVSPEDLKEFECLNIASGEVVTPEAKSVKPLRKRASEVLSSSESPKE